MNDIYYIIGGFSTILVIAGNVWGVFRLVNKMVSKTDLMSQQIDDFKKLLFTDDGKTRFVHTSDCAGKQEAIAKTIEMNFKLLKHEILASIDGRHKDTVKRIHERLDKIEK